MFSSGQVIKCEKKIIPKFWEINFALIKQKYNEELWIYWCFVKGFPSQLLCAVCTCNQNTLALDVHSNCLFIFVKLNLEIL